MTLSCPDVADEYITCEMDVFRAWMEDSTDNILVLGPAVQSPEDGAWRPLTGIMHVSNGFFVDRDPEGWDTAAEAEESITNTLREYAAIQYTHIRIYDCSTELAFAETCERLWPCPQSIMRRIQAQKKGVVGKVRVIDNISLVHLRIVGPEVRDAYEAAGWTVDVDDWRMDRIAGLAEWAKGYDGIGNIQNGVAREIANIKATQRPVSRTAIMRWVGLGEPPVPSEKRLIVKVGSPEW